MHTILKVLKIRAEINATYTLNAQTDRLSELHHIKPYIVLITVSIMDFEVTRTRF